MPGVEVPFGPGSRFWCAIATMMFGEPSGHCGHWEYDWEGCCYCGQDGEEDTDGEG